MKSVTAPKAESESCQARQIGKMNAQVRHGSLALNLDCNYHAPIRGRMSKADAME
jgi:hypothetical protein